MKKKLDTSINDLTFDFENDFYREIYPAFADCIYPISVGQPYHCEADFKATAGDANRKKYKSVIFMRACVLQRWTLMIENPELTEQQAWDIALKNGREWEANNKEAFEILKMPYRIIPWEAWLQHPNYKDCSDKIKELCKTDTLLQQKLDETVTSFIERHKKINPEIDEARCRELSTQYLLEEGTVFLIWAEFNYNQLIYPKKLTPFIDQLNEQLVHSVDPNKLICRNINLARTKKQQSLAHNLGRQGLFKQDEKEVDLEIILARCILSSAKAAISELKISESKLPKFQKFMKSEFISYIDSLGRTHVASNSI